MDSLLKCHFLPFKYSANKSKIVAARVGFSGRMRKEKTILYRGFKLELWNNRARSFRYEWKIRPLERSLRLMMRRGRIHRVMHDPTSMPTRASALDYGKMQINLLNYHNK